MNKVAWESMVTEVEEWRAAGRRLAIRIEGLAADLDAAVPEDDRFDSDEYADGTTALLVAASGLEVGIPVAPHLQGAISAEDWDRADRDYDFAAAAGKP